MLCQMKEIYVHKSKQRIIITKLLIINKKKLMLTHKHMIFVHCLWNSEKTQICNITCTQLWSKLNYPKNYRLYIKKKNDSDKMWMISRMKV